jgi:hypothetical protein
MYVMGETPNAAAASLIVTLTASLVCRRSVEEGRRESRILIIRASKFADSSVIDHIVKERFRIRKLIRIAWVNLYGRDMVADVICDALTGGWGWFLYGKEEEEYIARVRFALRADGRLEPVEAHVKGSPNLAGDAFAMPVTSMTAWANGRGYDKLVAAIAESGAETEAATEHWLKCVGSDASVLVPRSALTSRVRTGKRHPELRLRIPDGPRRPDSFYRKVGEAYMKAVEDHSHRPAQEIADENGVPVSTVRRWIREARSRNVLAPAERKGRAG